MPIPGDVPNLGDVPRQSPCDVLRSGDVASPCDVLSPSDVLRPGDVQKHSISATLHDLRKALLTHNKLFSLSTYMRLLNLARPSIYILSFQFYKPNSINEIGPLISAKRSLLRIRASSTNISKESSLIYSCCRSTSPRSDKFGRYRPTFNKSLTRQHFRLFTMTFVNCLPFRFVFSSAVLRSCQVTDLIVILSFDRRTNKDRRLDLRCESSETLCKQPPLGDAGMYAFQQN